RRLPALTREHPGQTLRRPVGRRHRARGRAHPEREPLPRPRQRPGSRGHQALPLALAGQDQHPERHGASRHRAALGRGRSADGSPSLLPRSPGAGRHPRAAPGVVMVQTISLHHVLHEAVATPYRDLVTRATGALVRGRIEATLAGSDWHTTLLDFSGVDCLDLSCADEIVAKLLLAAADRDRVVVLAGVREEQRDALEHVLVHHRLAVAARFRGSDLPDVLGWTSADARAAFAGLRAQGPADVAV